MPATTEPDKHSHGTHIGSASIQIIPDITGFGPLLSRQLGQRATVLLAGLGAAMTLPFIAATKAAMDFESAFAGVRKTVDPTTTDLNELEMSIRNLATEIPTTAVELSKIAQVAGQLGVEGAKNLTEFTETIAKLDVAADSIDAETAAMQIARFINVTGGSIGEVDNLSSALTDLGNNFPALEGEILNFSMLLAGVGNTFGLAQADILGFATALASAGIRAERGGSSISRMMVEMIAAISEGGPKLDAFARTAGMTADEFEKLQKSDPSEVIIRFIEGFGAIAEGSPADAIKVLDDLDLNTIRVRDTLLRTAAAADVVRSAIERGNVAFEENIALDKEFAKFAETTSSKLQVLKNRLTEVFIKTGGPIIGVLKGVIDVLTIFVKIIDKIPAPVLSLVASFAALTGVMLVLGGIVTYSLQFWSRLFHAMRVILVLIKKEGLIAAFRAMFFTMRSGLSAVDSYNRSVDKGVQLTLAGTKANKGFVTSITKLGRSFTSMGLAGWAAVAAITAAIAIGGLLYLNYKAVQRAAISVKDASKNLTEYLPDDIERVEHFKNVWSDLSDEVANVPDVFSIEFETDPETQDTIRTLQDMDKLGSATTYGAQLLFDMLLDGVPKEEALIILQRLFDLANLTMPVDLEIENPEDVFNVLKSEAADTGVALAKLIDTASDFRQPTVFRQPEAQKTALAMENTANTILDLMEKDPETAFVYWENAEAGIRSYYDQFRGTSGKLPEVHLEAQRSAIDGLTDSVLHLSGYQGLSEDKAYDMATALQEFSNIGVNVFSRWTDILAGTYLGEDPFMSKELEALPAQILKAQRATAGQAQHDAMWAPFIEATKDATEETVQIWGDFSGEFDLTRTVLQTGVSNLANAIATDMVSINESFMSGIPVLGQYEGAVKVELGKAQQSMVTYVKDTARITEFFQAIEGRIEPAAEAAIRSLSIGEQAWFAHAYLGDYSEADAEVVRTYLETLNQTIRDEQGLAEGESPLLTALGEKPTQKQIEELIPDIDWDTIVRIPPSVKEQMDDDAVALLETAFGVANLEAAFPTLDAAMLAVATFETEAYNTHLPSEVFSEPMENATLTPEGIRSSEGLGTSAGAGVIRGFNAAGITSAMVREMRASLAAAKGAIGANSPSKKFADEVGYPIAQGIALGINSGARDINNSLSSVLGTNGMRGAGARSRRGVTINIHNPTTRDLDDDVQRALLYATLNGAL